jgi:hypothetical protein
MHATATSMTIGSILTLAMQGHAVPPDVAQWRRRIDAPFTAGRRLCVRLAGAN